LPARLARLGAGRAIGGVLGALVERGQGAGAALRPLAVDHAVTQAMGLQDLAQAGVYPALHGGAIPLNAVGHPGQVQSGE
jgi:hypothetical protein